MTLLNKLTTGKVGNWIRGITAGAMLLGAGTGIIGCSSNPSKELKDNVEDLVPRLNKAYEEAKARDLLEENFSIKIGEITYFIEGQIYRPYVTHSTLFFYGNEDTSKVGVYLNSFSLANIDVNGIAIENYPEEKRDSLSNLIKRGFENIINELELSVENWELQKNK